jgi:septal ring factor EnvC (AmiA/AmiB activator)
VSGMESEITEIKNNISALQTRLDSLEREQHKLDKQLVEIKSDLNYLKSSQDSLNSNLSKFLWIVGGGFIAAVVSFIIKGGLTGGQ